MKPAAVMFPQPDPQLGAGAGYGANTVAVPASLVTEAIRARRAAAALQPLVKPHGIPFQRVRTPAEAHVYARMLIAHQRAAGNDMSDQPTAELAEARAQAVLTASLRSLDVHLNATGEDRALKATADISITSTDYWASLNKEFRELMVATDVASRKAAGHVPCVACGEHIPEAYRFCPHCGSAQQAGTQADPEHVPDEW